MKLRRLNLATRLGVGFGIILAILVALVVVGNALNLSNKKNLNNGLELANTKAELAVTMKSALLESSIAMRDIGLQADLKGMRVEEGRVKEPGKQYADAREKFEKLGVMEYEKIVLRPRKILT